MTVGPPGRVIAAVAELQLGQVWRDPHGIRRRVVRLNTSAVVFSDVRGNMLIVPRRELRGWTLMQGET